MGYVPEWSRANHAKSSNAPTDVAKPGTKYGIVSKELFERPTSPSNNAGQTPFTRHYAEGGEVNIKGDTVGEYSGDDSIVKYRMNQTDADGNDLRSKFTKDSVSSDRDMDTGMESDTSTKKETSADLDPYGAANKSQSSAKSSPVKSVAKAPVQPKTVVAKETSQDNDPYGAANKETSADLDPYKATSTNDSKKPYIDVPKNNVGMKQFGDGESPIGSLFKKMSRGSQRTRAANKSKDD